MIAVKSNSSNSKLPDLNGLGSSAQKSNSDPAGFASLLKQNQFTPPPTPPAMHPGGPQNPTPAHASQPTQPSQQGSQPTQDSNRASTTSHAQTSTQSSHKGEAKPSQQQVANKAATGGKHAGKEAADADASKASPDGAGTAADPTQAATDGTAAAGTQAQGATGQAQGDAAASPWLANLQHAQTTTPTQKALPDAASDASSGTNILGGDMHGAAGKRQLADLRAADLAGSAKAQATDNAAGPGGLDFATLVAQQNDSHAPASSAGPDSHVEGIKDASAMGAAGALAHMEAKPQIAAAPAPEPASVLVPTPMDTPEFARDLGVQLSMLAKDGVQSAQLHLNPADMGPVSVQIVMDGTRAHVEFAADVAATRHAIENGLPQLAGALAEAGFTLAGGGVSQHAHQGRSGQGQGQGSSEASGRVAGGTSRHAVSADGVARVSSAARKAATRGGVDLFA